MISGTIYAIIDNEYFYIGSTTQTIESRIGLHISASKNSSKKSKLYKYINEIRGGWKDILYITLENVECKTLKELKDKEYTYIKKFIDDKLCLNTISDIKTEKIIKFRLYKKKHNIL